MSRKLKVLVVEDEIYVAINLCAELEKLDIEVLKPESTGERAVEKATEERPDLIIMDIRLAGEMNGMEAAKVIKKQCKTPIVFITGYAIDYLQDQVEEDDYIDFFEKPVTIDQLIPLLDDLKENLKNKE